MDITAAPVVSNEECISDVHNVDFTEYKAPAENFETNSLTQSNELNQNVINSKSEESNVKNDYSELVINETYIDEGTTEIKDENIVQINENISNGMNPENVQNLSTEQEELVQTSISELTSATEAVEFDPIIAENSFENSLAVSDNSAEMPSVIEEHILEEENVVEEVVENEVIENVVDISQASSDVIEQEIVEHTTEIVEEALNESDEHTTEVVEDALNESGDSVTFEQGLIKSEGLQEIVVTQAELLSVPDPNMQYRIIPQELEDGTLVVEYTVKNDSQDTEDVSSEEVDNPEPNDPEYTEPNKQEIVREDVTKEPKPKGRKRRSVIPLHILGHNIEKPSVDIINGKSVIKPRLGVKVPYRTLSSQIVSKAELEGEIIKSAHEKQISQEQELKRASFARKMTHRLAQKLSGEKSALIKSDSLNKDKNTKELDKSKNKTSTTSVENESESLSESTKNSKNNVENIIDKSDKSSKVAGQDEENGNAKGKPNIESNQDLIAILEGNDEEQAVFPTKESDNQIHDQTAADISSELKQIEKEISETPKKTKSDVKKNDNGDDIKDTENDSVEKKEKSDTPRTKKFFKSRDKSDAKENSKYTSNKNKNSDTSETSDSKSSGPKKDDSNKNLQSKKEDLSKSKESNKSTKDKKEKSVSGPVEVEPQLNASMVMKTYSRKRKSTDLATPTPSVQKKPTLEETSSTPSTSHNDFVLPTPPQNTYITKSSRIIKKKVIWDPDEAFPSKASQAKILSKIETSTKNKSSEKNASPEKKIVEKEKKVITPKETKQVTEKSKKLPEKEKRLSTEKIDKEKKVPLEKEKKISPEKKPEVSNAVKKLTNKKIIVVSADMINSSPRKRKHLSEIDKLLMDEGAVNMLYDINASEEQKTKSKNKSVISLDKAQKDLVNKAKELKNELTLNSGTDSTTKSLRKKDGTSPLKRESSASPATTNRKMSKDSSKSSVHSPPPSPSSFAEASRIIRRHSSSDSFSSMGEEVSNEDTDKSASQSEPEKEKQTKKKSGPPASAEAPKKKARKESESPLKVSKVGVKVDPDKSFIVIKRNKQVSIELTYGGNESYLSPLMLKELTIMLKELAKMNDCNVVYVHSRNSDFCLGLDYKGLVESNKDLRKKRSVQLASYVKEFIKTLLHFPKVLVAGVQGTCVGLGTTILPLFDLVVANDSATFSTPYSRLGCAPEGGFCFAVSHIFQGVVSELLYTNQKVGADEAHRKGLVSKLYWSEKFDAELNKLLNNIGKMSTQGLEKCKKQLHQMHHINIESVLQHLNDSLIESWISAECQQNFVGYSAKN